MFEKVFLLILFIAELFCLNIGAEQPELSQPKLGQSQLDQPRFQLVNQVCAVVESEQPILMSDVIKRAKEHNIDHRSAQDELLGERALWVYAKQQLKYNVQDIYKSATEHIKKIIENNNLTREKFDQILMKPPYSTTYRQYESEMAYFVLRNQVESTLAASIQISEEEVKAEYERQRLNKLKDFSVIFISVLPIQSKTPANIPDINNLNKQFLKANQIRKLFIDKNTLSVIKNKYKGQRDVSFVGPLDYKEGALKHKYDVQLKRNSAALITDPFEDNGAVTMILRIEKAVSEDNEKTGLEEVQKDLYKRAVQRRLDAVTKNTLASSSVEINCEW